MSFTERLHQHRFQSRRGWALATLPLHVERTGGCIHCETVTGTKVAWPRMQVRLAEYYLE
jgi:hypothetical protein